MLDSGAYSAFRKNTKIDIEMYIDFVKSHGKHFECCVNLDVIGNAKASYDNWLYLRAQGVDTMPVYHIGTPEEYLVKYLKDTDYVGLGAIARLDSAARMNGLTYIWDKYLRDKKGKAKYKVHGMGLTAVPIVIRYPWYSIDSVSPIVQSAYGGIYLPALKNGKRDFLNLTCYKVSSKSSFHQTGKMASFFNLPVSLKEYYEEYFKSKGFVLGKLNYNVHTVKSAPLLFEDVAEIEGVKDEELKLVNSHLARADWNLLVWKELNKRASALNGQEVLIYVGVGATAQYFKLVEKRKLSSLLSYYLVNREKILNTLLNSIK